MIFRTSEPARGRIRSKQSCAGARSGALRACGARLPPFLVLLNNLVIAVHLGLRIFVPGALAISAAWASGPCDGEVYYANPFWPAYGLEPFVAGKLGTLTSNFAPELLVPAYRHLSGAGVDAAGVHVIVEGLNHAPQGGTSWYEASRAWVEARQRVLPQAPPLHNLQYNDWREQREVRGEQSWSSYYPNCLGDAALTAARTLASRASEHGADSLWVQGWIEAQDQVFSNCRTGETIPAALPPDAPSWARLDREYQIASAQFYAARLDEAESRFAAIASSSASPWRHTARYMVLRCKVRLATLDPEGGRNERLASAEEAIRSYLEHPVEDVALESSAKGLLRFVQAQREPDRVRRELAAMLSAKSVPQDFGRVLKDYAHILYPLRSSIETGERPALADLEDLTAWILTIRNPSVYAEAARVRWETTKSLPWLVAALGAPAGTPGLEEAIVAGEALPESSPAFFTANLTVAWHHLTAKRFDAARRTLLRLDKILGPKAPLDERNRLDDVRAELAGDLKEWIVAKAQHPVGTGDICSSGMQPLDIWGAGAASVWFSAVPTANRWLDAGHMAELAGDVSLPVNLRRDFALAAWTRLVLLRDEAGAAAIAPRVSELLPEMAPHMRAYTKAPSGKARAFAAALILLRHPGLRPFLVGDRDTEPYKNLTETPGWRWCGGEAAFVGPWANGAGTAEAPPRWADQGILDATASERTRAKTLEGAPIELGRIVLDWARVNTGDPRVPEALYLIVQSTRVGCDQGRGREVAKPAFELLHRRYPASSWAKKTPYWYD